ncbi:uncharacterized protein LOC133457971 [Cololabis saira]|uniref:uncharacterized protein LOC133457971 n=1 Tax=Cololabis saira TaxID=129043 RepID=UPI002AD55B57|nr:uncharacterized protein LOC133457971 [Cololabis saira]
MVCSSWTTTPPCFWTRTGGFPLYQNAHDTSTYYLNPDCTTVANLVKAEDSQTTTESFKENAGPLSPSPSPALPANEGFTRDQTLFLIELMRHHLETEADGLPKTLKELNARLKSARSNKKNLWIETAEKLSTQFSVFFCPDKVARKWNTLVDGYKRIKDNNSWTGKGTIRFKFFCEMDELLRGQHDVAFPVVGTDAGLDIRRPEVLRSSAVTAPLAEASSATLPTPSTTPTRPHKRRREQDDVLQFLRESQEASQRRHEEAQRRHEEAQRRHEELLAQLKGKVRFFTTWTLFMTFFMVVYSPRKVWCHLESFGRY